MLERSSGEALDVEQGSPVKEGGGLAGVFPMLQPNLERRRRGAKRYHVVVVGGGPAGAMAALTAAEAGARVLVIERSPNRLACCTGLVGPRALDLLDLPARLVVQVVRSVRVYAPGGKSVEFEAPVPKGFVLDRCGLDRWLLARAAEAGAVVRRGVAAEGLEGRLLHTTAGPLTYDVLIGADGVQSVVRRGAGLPSPGEVLAGAQARVAAALPGDAVEVHLGSEVAPGFFAWVVPYDEGTVLAGLLTTDVAAAASLLDRFLGRRFPRAHVYGVANGLVPVGPPSRTVRGPVLIVGNAAGQVKPLSGGGILFGALSARAAGDIAARAPLALAQYEDRWRSEIGEEIAFGLRARRAFLSLSDDVLDRAIPSLDRSDLRRLIAREGDIDRPSGLVRSVLATPRVWPAILPLVEALGGWARVLELVQGLLPH